MQYKVINDDIKLIEKTRSKDLMVKLRLFELYTEKHRLINKREKELEIFGGAKAMAQIRRFKKIKRSVLKKIEKLSGKISNYIKDKDVLAKLYYFKALSYHLEKRKKLFYQNLKKAEANVGKNQYQRQIFTRLAEHHYNEKQFTQAEYYYEKLLKLSPDVWLKKNLFNLSWIYLKLEKSDKAINTLKRVYELPKDKKYHELGSQLDRTIILFYAISQRITAGLRFLRSKNLNNFKNLMLFLRYNSENGDKNKTSLIMNELERINKTITERAILLAKTIEIYRADGKHFHIHKKIAEFSQLKEQYNKIEKSEKDNLITQLKSYTGFLQVMLKSKGSDEKGRKNKILNYVIYNFDLLAVLDPNKNIEYHFLKGESSIVMKKYKKALGYYKKSIIIYSKLKKKDTKRIAPIYDSLYYCLERLEKDKSYISNLIWGYKTYLLFQPKGKLSDQIYQNYLALHFEQKNMKEIPKVLKMYNKNFPKKLELQRKYYKKLVQTHVKDKGLTHLTDLRVILKKGFLGYGKKEVKNITLIINELYFKQYDELYKKGDFKGALKGFKGIVMNKKHDYDLRIDSLINVLKINHDHKMYVELSDNLGIFLRFAKKPILEKNHDKVRYYVSLFCNNSMEKACYGHTKFLDKSLKKAMDNYLYEKLFKLHLFNDKYLPALKLLKTHKHHMAYFMQVLMLNKREKLFNFIKKVRDKEIINAIKPELVHMAWTVAFASKDMSQFQKFKVEAIGVKFLEFTLKDIQRQFANLKRKLRPVPIVKVPNQITFEAFSKYLQTLIADNQKFNQKVDALMKNTNPYLTFSILSYAVQYYRKLVNYTQNYRANSTDQNLNTAINNEIKKFTNLYLTKIRDYSNVKNKLMLKITDKTGAAKLYYDKSMGTFQVIPFQRSLLWK